LSLVTAESAEGSEKPGELHLVAGPLLGIVLALVAMVVLALA
jgi:hypothetical protein